MSEVFENLDRMMQKEASERNPVRAITAAQIEADQKFSSFLENDRESRLAFLDDDIQTIAQKYANEYNVDSDVVYKGVVHFLAQKSSNYDDYEPRDYDDYMDSNDYAGMESWYQDLLDQGHSPEEARAIIQHEQSLTQGGGSPRIERLKIHDEPDNSPLPPRLDSGRPLSAKVVDPTKGIGGKEENTKYKNWTVKQKDKNLGLEKQDVSPPTEHVREFFQPQGDAPYSHFDDEPGGKTPYKADAKEEDITKKTGPEPKIQSKSSTEDGDYFLDIKQSAKIDHNYKNPQFQPPPPADSDLGDYLQIRDNSLDPDQLRAPGEHPIMDDNFGGMSNPQDLQDMARYYHQDPMGYLESQDDTLEQGPGIPDAEDYHYFDSGADKAEHQQRHNPYPPGMPIEYHDRVNKMERMLPNVTERQQAIKPYSHVSLGDPAVDWFAVLKQHVSNIKNKLESIDYSRPGR